jgi:hypothetical protein
MPARHPSCGQHHYRGVQGWRETADLRQRRPAADAQHMAAERKVQALGRAIGASNANDRHRPHDGTRRVAGDWRRRHPRAGRPRRRSCKRHTWRLNTSSAIWSNDRCLAPQHLTAPTRHRVAEVPRRLSVSTVTESTQPTYRRVNRTPTSHFRQRLILSGSEGATRANHSRDIQASPGSLVRGKAAGLAGSRSVLGRVIPDPFDGVL